MLLNLDEIKEGLNDAMHDRIHRKYGVEIGLFKEDYRVFFDPDPEIPNWDIHVKAGKVVHILIRTAPWNSDFEHCLRTALINHHPPFKAFHRSATEERQTNAYEGLITKHPEFIDRKKVGVHAFARQILISVRLIDKKTKAIKEVIVRNGDVFTAQEMAIKLLYGERYGD